MPGDFRTSSRRADERAADPWRTKKPREQITLHGLEGEVLARSSRGDGRHLVVKIALGGVPAVLKLYGRKRDWLKDTLRDVGHRWFLGKTGMTPRARWQTERETLALWRRHGFDVPAELDLPLPAAVPPMRLLSEWIAGLPLYLPIESEQWPLAEKTRLLSSLASDWSRRHALAIELVEPRLIQSHAVLVHLFWVQADAASPDRRERLVTFDFEVAWARRSVLPRLVSLEIAQFLDSVARWAPLPQLPALIEAFVRGYPDRERLKRVAADVKRGRLPWFAWITRLGLQLRERGPRRKLAVLRHLDEALAQTAAKEAVG